MFMSLIFVYVVNIQFGVFSPADRWDEYYSMLNKNKTKRSIAIIFTFVDFYNNVQHMKNHKNRRK